MSGLRGCLNIAQKQCVDCRKEGITTKRKAKYPGPRCHTHHRLRKQQQSRARHGSHILETYGITSEEYEAIYKAQGGRCAICQRATGRSKRLAVDHDHATLFVRGLLCKSCNRNVLGHLRDDPEALQRAINYLAHPPAFDVIGKRKTPR
ncbi:endonuclease VII domain-containing protein [Corynebacterium coyleae]|uniref:endonuclease VII domain-containing protein n=1 Tax=Corynebacterium coyleae TaxID=53374 RepID=UPI001CCD8846|nr:endonuclease VII domain-containing protein [Corynebacterium coyleae]UBI10020.1 endonuclease VII domain-containing protein [Corynebacterium coyleae]